MKLDEKKYQEISEKTLKCCVLDFIKNNWKDNTTIQEWYSLLDKIFQLNLPWEKEIIIKHYKLLVGLSDINFLTFDILKTNLSGKIRRIYKEYCIERIQKNSIY